MSKTLSNGTLSLRFMQNAQRAKQSALVEAEQAQVRDEAEWEVSKEVRERWGVAPSSSEVTQEASYVPFMLEDVKVTGRRTFRKGEEVVEDEHDVPNTPIPEEYPKGKRPITLSGSGATIFTARRDSKAKPASPHGRGASVLKMLSEERGKVGLDMRTVAAMEKGKAAAPALAPETSAVFLRPAGVDAPSVPKAEAKAEKRKRGGGEVRSLPVTADAEASERKLKKKKKKVKNSSVDVETPDQ